MSGIGAKNTKPELLLRRGLHKRGFRYSLHDCTVPGKPDMVFRPYNAVIFVHGCFWHGHDCKYFRLPSTHTAFWKRKIESNRKRDAEIHEVLAKQGWRQLVVWECATRGKSIVEIDMLTISVARWLRSRKMVSVIRDKNGAK